jgi:hypothetical protein
VLSLVIAIALAVPVAAPYDVGFIQETRAATSGTLAVQLSPFLGLSTAPGGAQGSVRYEPRLVFDEQSSGFSEALHRATLSGTLLDRERDRLFFNGRGAYGRTSLSPDAALAEGALPSLDRPAQAKSLLFIDCELTAGVEERIGRRVSLVVDASYALNGGATTRDRALLPLFEVGRLRAAVALRASRRDSFSLTLSGSLSRVALLSSRSKTFEGSVTWERRLPAALTGSLTAGLGVVGTTDRTRSRQSLLAPTGAAALRGRTAGRKLELTLSARIVPFIDPVDGSVSLRPEASGQAELAASRHLSFAGSAAIAPVKTADGRRSPYGVGSLAALYRPAKFIQFSLGMRLIAQPDARFAGFVSLSMLQHGLLW